MAGTAMVLPECRPLWDGVEEADSLVFNPHKWMGVGFDFSAYYVRDPEHLIRVMSTNPSYLRTAQDGEVKNYRDWHIPLGRRFRALKLWFYLLDVGVEGLQARIRRDLANAQWLREQVDAAPGWERLAPVPLQTVCLRHVPQALAGDEPALTRHNLELARRVNESGAAYLTPSRAEGPPDDPRQHRRRAHGAAPRRGAVGGARSRRARLSATTRAIAPWTLGLVIVVRTNHVEPRRARTDTTVTVRPRRECYTWLMERTAVTRHPKGSRARVLLTSVFGPYARDDEHGSRAINPMELYHNQVTRAQGAFSLRMFHRSWGLMLIQANLEAPTTLLDFPSLERFEEEIRTRALRRRRHQRDPARTWGR